MTKNKLGFELRELEDAINALNYYIDACKLQKIEASINEFENFLLEQIKTHQDRLKKH